MTNRCLSHTVLSCIVSCGCEHYVRISEQRCLMEQDWKNGDFPSFLVCNILLVWYNMHPVTVLLHVLGQLLAFLSDLAVLLFKNCIDVNVHTVVLLGK